MGLQHADRIRTNSGNKQVSFVTWKDVPADLIERVHHRNFVFDFSPLGKHFVMTETVTAAMLTTQRDSRLPTKVGSNSAGSEQRCTTELRQSDCSASKAALPASPM
jgi:hypothetical protein